MLDILVVCTGNICRSPMAAGLLQALLPPELKTRVNIASAGTHALHGHQPASHAAATMARQGIDIRSHRARQVSPQMIKSADLVLAMEKEHVRMLAKLVLWKRPPIKLLSEFDPGNDPADPPDIADPYGGPPEVYQQCLDILHPCVAGVMDWILSHDNLKTADHRDA